MPRTSHRTRRGNITEFALIFSLLLPLIVFPMINLGALAAAAATALLAVHQAAGGAAVQQTYGEALSAMNSELTNFYNSGFANLTRMSPVGGYANSGANLFVVATNFRAPSITTSSSANAPIAGSIDPTTYIYECRVDLSVEVNPLVDLHSVPFIGQVCGVGRPAILKFSANRVAEHPTGLSGAAADNAANNAASATAPLGSIAYSLDQAMPRLPVQSGWNYPNIYDSISANGQTPTDEDVLFVRSDNPGWTRSHFHLNQNDNIWIDYQSDGVWKAATQANFVMADGYANIICPNGFPQLSMIAQVGNGKPFLLGSQKTFSAQGSGTLYVAANSGKGPIMGANIWTVDSDYAGNQGAMMVRIVIAHSN